MMKNIQIYKEKAIEEILNPKFTVTKQNLAINKIEFINGVPKIERIDLNYADNLVAVYFPFKGERYFLRININKSPHIEVDFVNTESGNNTYLTATSYDLTFQELAEDLTLKPLTGWSKGDKPQYIFSRILYEPFVSEAYELESQIDLLLAELEKDADKIRRLTIIANTYISVCRHQYINASAGINFSKETIKRLSNLNLSIDIDTYIVGKEIIDEDA